MVFCAQAMDAVRSHSFLIPNPSLSLSSLCHEGERDGGGSVTEVKEIQITVNVSMSDPEQTLTLNVEVRWK